MRRLIFLSTLPLLAAALGCDRSKELAAENEILKEQTKVYRKTIAGLQSQIDGLKSQQAPPTWTKMSSWVELNSQGKTFYGVGIAQGIRNGALALSAADARARAEIAKLMGVEVEQFGSLTRANAKATLREVEIVEHWKDPEDGSRFALAKMTLKPSRR